MTPNNNLNVLPFYGSIGEQNHRKEYAYGDIYTLIAPKNTILPFQIKRANRAVGINKARLHDLKAGTYTSILPQLNASGMTIKSYTVDGEEYDVISNPSVFFPTLIIPQGQYYLELGDGQEDWFSDVFTVVNDLGNYMKLEYWDEGFIDYIDYTYGYKNYLFIQSKIGKPEYPFTEEVKPMDGYTFFEKQLSEKKYKFTFTAPEYLCDALRVVRMHDYIRITENGKTYEVDNIILDPEWQERGDIAIVKTEFQCDTVIKKTGKGMVENTTGGSFNNSYNNSFQN